MTQSKYPRLYSFIWRLAHAQMAQEQVISEAYIFAQRLYLEMFEEQCQPLSDLERMEQAAIMLEETLMWVDDQGFPLSVYVAFSSHQNTPTEKALQRSLLSS